MKKFAVKIRDGCGAWEGEIKTYKQIWEDNMHICHEAEIGVEQRKLRQKNGGGEEELDSTMMSVGFLDLFF